jgi:hypothetical protein
MRQLIRTMSLANPLCGAPRIHGEPFPWSDSIYGADVTRRSRGRIVDKSLRTREGLELLFAIYDDFTAADPHAVFGQRRHAAG